MNSKGKHVYELKAKSKPEKTQGKSLLSKTQMDSLNAELHRTGVTMETVQDRYKIREPEQMTQELYNKVMAALSKTKPADAA